MALIKLLVLFVIFVAACANFQHEVKADDKAKKALEAEKEQSTRTANPGQKGSFRKLSKLMNRTASADKPTRSRGRNLKDVMDLNAKHKQLTDHNDNMMNDNEGVIAINRDHVDNDTLAKKMHMLRNQTIGGINFEPMYKNTLMPQTRGVYCDFERLNATGIDTCQWQWNGTVSRHGLGFQVMTAADVVRMNGSSRGLKFTGPGFDAEGNVEGHFLYLPVDPTMGNMVIKSPPFRSLWEFCKFEAYFHQSKMQNASIRLISETAVSEVLLILQEVAGNNLETWHPLRFMVGKVNQAVEIMIEITQPLQVSLAGTLPHIAIDNVRMIECLPEPPVVNGNCSDGHMKCMISSKQSCIKMQQVCDLVKDCDDGMDEQQSCDKMPYGSYCNFEHNLCGFENIPQPILKWLRHSGPTPTEKTGPNFDHTCGPPDPHHTPKLPPLSPAHLNITLGHCIGYYLFVNMNVSGPNSELPSFASTAVVQTVVFNPPPRVHGNITSKYYNCCMIRFYYQQNGRNYGSLALDVVELTTRGNMSTALWFSTKDKGENWYRAAIFLPNITRRYFLQFKTRMGMRIYSDSAIDDFSLAPECFGLNIPKEELGDYNYYEPKFDENLVAHRAFVNKTFYRFTTCGASGRFGPTPQQCAEEYNGTELTVHVISSDPMQGVQVWEVPEEGMYTIIATGASGGLGSAWTGISHGAVVRTLIQFHKGELVHILVGQHGQNACKKDLSRLGSQECYKRGTNESMQVFTSKTHEVRNTEVQDGGGGGGGGTYVFLMDTDGKAYPLIAAGGGGGISVGQFQDDTAQHGRPPAYNNATPESGYMYGDPSSTAGAGGGWLARSGPSTPGFELIRGASLRSGGVGGRACVGVAHGGFGGGGGGCKAGGGGGGWIGGSTNQGHNGGGGISFVDSTRTVKEFTYMTTAQHMASGELVIIPAIHGCGCDYRCVALNEYRSEVKCYCPEDSPRNENDPTKCILNEGWFKYSYWIMIILSAAVTITLSLLFGIFLYLYNGYQRKKEEEAREKITVEQEMALRRLRNPPGGNDQVLSAFNPHYGCESFLPQGIDVRGLPQVTRESLKLVKALGQGAFGEVYQGLYKHQTGNSVDMPVAVKTLPDMSSDQAESEFLMEAAIMAKFNHPNIVHLIGVCFDRHPRFIVIELLAGGDLKVFLRESRPRPERASALTMKDLLLCAIDVCKGCRYLEAKRFIHRDIAARNCLLTSRGPGRVVKIADFGMARDIYRADYYKKGGKAMLPIKWMPPEAYIDGVFTIKTDVWSYGVLIWEVFSLGVMPYTGCSNREVMELVSGGGRLEKPYCCPQEVYLLMCECWKPAPIDRPSFAHMYDRLAILLSDPEIVDAPLPVLRSLFMMGEVYASEHGTQRTLAGDYLVPMSPGDAPTASSSTDHLVPHSSTPTELTGPDNEDLQFQHLLKVSQEYGNIQMGTGRAGARGAGESGKTPSVIKFQSSDSTDRLLSSVEDGALDGGAAQCGRPAVWETSFTEPAGSTDAVLDSGPVVDKLISITPTSPKPPENALSKAMETHVIDKTNHKSSLVPERKPAPIASPDPPRINACSEPPKLTPKPKPLCLDAAQLEQNLNALKKNSGSVNLNTMNIRPPNINVVTPNKLSESKTIQIDPKKAVIHDLQSPKEESKKEEGKLKTSSSAASLLNGPMTDVPYADSDNASSSSGSNPPNHITTIQKSKQNDYSEVKIGKNATKQGSLSGDVNDSEISC